MESSQLKRHFDWFKAQIMNRRLGTYSKGGHSASYNKHNAHFDVWDILLQFWMERHETW